MSMLVTKQSTANPISSFDSNDSGHNLALSTLFTNMTQARKPNVSNQCPLSKRTTYTNRQKCLLQQTSTIQRLKHPPTQEYQVKRFYKSVTTQSYLFMHDIPKPDTIFNIKIHSCADDIASPAELLKYKTATNILQR